jgi:hypothetical protein
VIITTVVIQSLTSVKVAKMLEQRAPAPYGFGFLAAVCFQDHLPRN